MSSAPMYLDGLGLLVHAGEVELTKRSAIFSRKSDLQPRALSQHPTVALGAGLTLFLLGRGTHPYP